ncbi:glycosyltransferase [Rubrivirga sp. IMCC43871]|uniref:glycosyltransferase n=1 Tax=Rubrivirga sp. IMCC43871 TaxID=3391575 RepID=UPI00398FF15E
MLAVALIAFAVQLAVWAAVAVGVRRVREAGPEPLAHAEAALGAGLPISVVVAAHNEADRLPTLLDALAAQGHRPFEVVIVDDRSTDRTGALAAWRAADFPVPLRVVRVDDGAPEAAGLPPKKHALERGVEAARHPRLAFTDADGQPGPDWLAPLARAAVGTNGADDGAVLVGYGPYVREPGALNRFVRYETVQTAALAAAGVGLGRPWHAVGRNFSYPRDLLARLGGFAHSAGSLSGDDDLLVQEVARTKAAPVRYVWDPAAAVPTPAPPTWRAFWRQKRRHASAGTHYAPAVLVALGAVHISNLVLWVAAPVLHVALGTPIGWGLLAAKLLLQRSVIGDVLDGLGDEPDVRLWQPVLDGASAVYHQILAVLGALPTPKRW